MLVKLINRHITPYWGLVGIVLLLRDVLAERRPFQDLREDQDLMNIARQGVQDYRAHLATLAPDDRAALMAQAEVIAASEVG